MTHMYLMSTRQYGNIWREWSTDEIKAIEAVRNSELGMIVKYKGVKIVVSVSHKDDQIYKIILGPSKSKTDYVGMEGEYLSVIQVYLDDVRRHL